jgi:hypothetical protein
VSKIQVAAVMCDDEYGCGDFEVTYFEWADTPTDWGIETRDIGTEHLCWDCVYAANEDPENYLRVKAP